MHDRNIEAGNRRQHRHLHVHGDDRSLDQRSPTEGTFRYEDLEPGLYHLGFVHDAWRGGPLTGEPIRVRPGEVTNLAEVHPERVRRLSGMIATWRATVSGDALATADESGETLEALRALGYVQ